MNTDTTYTKLQTNHWRRIKREREGMFWNCILPYKFYYFRIIVFILCTVCSFFSHIEFPDDIHLLKCATPSIWPSISSVTNQPDRQYQPWLLTSPSWLLMWSDWQKFELTNSLLTLTYMCQNTQEFLKWWHFSSRLWKNQFHFPPSRFT